MRLLYVDIRRTLKRLKVKREIKLQAWSRRIKLQQHSNMKRIVLVSKVGVTITIRTGRKTKVGIESPLVGGMKKIIGECGVGMK